MVLWRILDVRSLSRFLVENVVLADQEVLQPLAPRLIWHLRGTNCGGAMFAAGGGGGQLDIWTWRNCTHTKVGSEIVSLRQSALCFGCSSPQRTCGPLLPSRELPFTYLVFSFHLNPDHFSDPVDISQRPPWTAARGRYRQLRSGRDRFQRLSNPKASPPSLIPRDPNRRGLIKESINGETLHRGRHVFSTDPRRHSTFKGTKYASAA